jgi:hypothetical protein
LIHGHSILLSVGKGAKEKALRKAERMGFCRFPTPALSGSGSRVLTLFVNLSRPKPAPLSVARQNKYKTLLFFGQAFTLPQELW